MFPPYFCLWLVLNSQKNVPNGIVSWAEVWYNGDIPFIVNDYQQCLEV